MRKFLLLFLLSLPAFGQYYPPTAITAQNPNNQQVYVALDSSNNLDANMTGSGSAAVTVSGYIPPVSITGQNPSGAQVYLKTDSNGNLYVNCQVGCSGGGSLPVATGAGQAPVSTGPGTTYTAQAVSTYPTATGTTLQAPATTDVGVTYPAVPVFPQAGVWQREGTIISPTLAEQYGASEPTLIYEGSPQLLSGTTGNIFKMWWTCGYLTTGLCYAESIDGENWTRAASPVIARVANTGVAHGYVFHYSTTYYYYTANGAGSATQINVYTSTNGTTWTLAHSGVLTLGTTGAWDATTMGNVYVIPSSGTWQMMYEAYGGAASNNTFWMGVATSADQGVTWTKYSGNPVLKGPSSGDAGGPEIHLVTVNSVPTYFVWYTCNAVAGFFPTDICRARSTDFQTWTQDNGTTPVMIRATADEGAANSSAGQIADFSMVEVGGSIYVVYDGVLAQNGTTPDAFHLKLATAPLTFAQLVQTNEGSATDYHASGSFGSLNLSTCIYWDNNFNRTPCANSIGQFLIGTFSFQGAATYPGFGQNIYYDGTNNRYAVAGYLHDQYLDIAGGVEHFAMAASGSANATVTPTDYMTASPTSGVTFTNGFTASTCVWWYNNYTHAPCSNGTGQFQIGTTNFTGGAYPSVNQNLYYNGSNNAYAISGYASSAYLDVSGGIYHFGMAPSGTAAATATAADIWQGTTTGVTFPKAIKQTPLTVGTLPSASTAGAGTIYVVSDGAGTPPTCTGSGSNYQIAVSNGTSWTCH